ncbi:MAG: hypothetical protein ACR2NX_11105 [Chthoniobacterales bacterium]
MQTVIDKYSPLTSAVNQHVAEFNEFLIPENQLKLVDPTDAATFCVLADIPWNSRWPGSGYAGMYVFGAYDEKDRSQLAAYVGRASFRNIGNHVSSLLNARRSTEIYTMRSGPDMFRLEVLMAIAITTPTMRSMACALEEHVVKYGLDGIYLLNGLETRPAI